MTKTGIDASKIITCSFTEPFIDNLAGFIKENYIDKGADLSRLAVVFGGKRPALFVKRRLASMIGENFYPPRFFTIDDFMGYVLKKRGPYKSAPDLDSCYLLYGLAQKHCPEILKGREHFAQFLPWTREILAFIDQLDLELVTSERLKNVESNARIGFDVPADINRLLEHIVVLREAYHRELAARQACSRGLVYARAAEAASGAAFDEFDQVLFCNFFYFHKSEELLVEELFKRNLATMIFQGDERKWPVLTRIAKKFGCRLYEGDEPDPTAFDLKLYSGFDVHSQAGVVREVLRNIPEKDETVVVLPDADNIIPLISEVSQAARDFNVSMGYPLRRSSLYSLFEFIFKAQLSRQEARYYARDYLKALGHPFVKNLRPAGADRGLRALIGVIEDALAGREETGVSGSLFVRLEDIEACAEIFEKAKEALAAAGVAVKVEELRATLGEVHKTLFAGWEGVTTFAAFGATLGAAIDVFVRDSPMERYPLNMNIASKMYALKDEFARASFAAEAFPFEDMVHIFEGKVSRELVAFVGSPLKGLQVLGLFETRSLNFKHVIVLDVNEGALPNLRVYEPLIPREVMIGLNLDRLELEEEIQRYLFMRLISSAETVHLVYQESRDKERSRFVEELVWEEQKRTGSAGPLEARHAAFNVRVRAGGKRAKKTPAMVEALKKHRYSASSLNMYMRNPMDFYYNYVLGLREQEDLLDEPEARHVGTFAHNLLEAAFRPFAGKKPVIDHAFRKNFEKLFEAHFAAGFGRSMRGEAFLLRKVLVERLNRFVDNEAENPRRRVEEILYLEKRFEETIALSCGNISFAYIVDRVDRLADGTIMVLDYKTGGLDVMPKDIAHIDGMELSREAVRDTVKSFQVPLYYHYLHQHFGGGNINAALYNLRTLTLSEFIGPRMSFTPEQINAAFLRALDFILTEILDPGVDFIEDLSFLKSLR